MDIDFKGRYSIAKHGPTDLTERLRTSKPGEVVEFTLAELLQKVVLEKGQRWSSDITVLPGPITYREAGSDFSCQKCIKEGKICLRVDPVKYPDLPICCANCVAVEKPCNVTVSNFGLEEKYHRKYLPLDNLTSVNEILERKPIKVGDSRDWGGACDIDDYELVFRVMTACEDLPWAGGSGDGHGQKEWIKQLFSYFPNTIKEINIVPTPPNSYLGSGSDDTVDEISTWAIVIPPSSAPQPSQQTSSGSQATQQTSQANPGKGNPSKGKKGGAKGHQGPSQKPAAAQRKAASRAA